MRKDKTAYLERVQLQIEKAEGINFLVPDDTGFFSLDDDLIPRVRSLMGETLELTRELGDLYDAESLEAPVEDAGAEDDFLREIGAAISSELATRELSNLAFVVRAQIMETHESLASAISSRHTWAVVSHADTGLRRVSRGLLTLETAIREYEGLAPAERRWSDLKDSLETRRLYGQFRRAILRSEQNPAEDQASRLRAAVNRIAILRDLKIYPFLRIDDRVSIRRLQKRIIAWLDRDGDPRKDEEGRQLWSDLVSFAELLGQVNNREDLREHDRKTVSRLHRVLFEARQAPSRILPSHLADLELLLGRDEDLDRIILSPHQFAVEDLREPLERVQSQLNRSFAPIEESLTSLL